MHVTGITISPRQLALAEAAAGDIYPGKQVHFQLVDAAHMPFADSAYDAAFAVESLLHMSSRQSVLSEIARVVRPGGRLVVADLLLRDRDPARHQVTQDVDSALQDLQILPYTTEAEYRTAFEKSGWEIIELTDIGENIRPTYRHLSRELRELAPRSRAGSEALLKIAAINDRIAEYSKAAYALISANNISH